MRSRVFYCGSGEGYEEVRVNLDSSEMFTGVSVAESWRPPSAEIVRFRNRFKERKDDPRWFLRRWRLRPSDFPMMFQRPSWAVSERAVAALGEIFRSCGEILPMECRDRALYAFNCTRVVDALDERLSDVDRFEDGRMYALRRFVAKDDVLVEAPIFRLPEGLNQVYVTEDFVLAVKSAGLVGLRFVDLST